MRNIPEKISRTKRRKYFFCHSGNEEHGDQNCRRSKFSKMLPLFCYRLSTICLLEDCAPITINRDVTPLSQGPHITHLLSEELRFVVGTHFSIETSWPPALPAHHWITMVSLLWGERTDLDRRAETLLTGTTGGTKRWQSGERAFSGRCLSRCLSVSLLLPPGAACASLTSLAGCWRERDGCSGICLERVAPLRLVSSLESNQSNARGEHRPFQIVSLLRSSLKNKCSAASWSVASYAQGRNAGLSKSKQRPLQVHTTSMH